MADVAELPLIKPTAFSDGTDTILGIERMGVRKRPLNTVGFIPEGSLEESRREFVETPGAPWSGPLVMSGVQALAYVGTTIASATIAFVDLSTGSSGTMTITNMKILDIDAGVTRNQKSSATHRWEADSVVFS